MVTDSLTQKNVMLLLFKDFSSRHTITSLAKELHLSRVGVWKVLKRLENKNYITFASVGPGKTSTSLITITWENILVEKALSLYLTEEALQQRRWRANFAELESATDFLILYGSILRSPQQAHDIDVVGAAKKNKFLKIQSVLDKVQKTLDKKIHAIHFTETEFKEELQKPNKVFIEAVRTGVILFGQERFVTFIKRVHSHG